MKGGGMMLTAGIAVDRATLDFDRIFSYSVPPRLERQVRVGSQVLVPFGRGNTLRMGVVMAVEDTEPDRSLKAVVDARADGNVVTDRVMDLVRYLKENTFCTWYEAFRTVVPYGAMYRIAGGRLEKTLVRYQRPVYTSDPGRDTASLKNDKQRAVYRFCAGGRYDIKQITAACGVGPSVVKNLARKGILREEMRDRRTTAYADIEASRRLPELTAEQQKVYEEIKECEDSKPHLLHGVTSSGKTMIFIRLVRDVLESGGSAMILVPEISLTPSMIRLVKEYFGDVVSVIHSALTATERLLQYNRALNGTSRVVIGTRSAVFAPLDDLRLIIIDEEHEKTFKSESSPRYSAIRVARHVARNTGAKLLLASATPSIESYSLAERGYYHLHTLTRRYMDLPLPRVKVVDMALSPSSDGGPVSDEMIDRMRRSFENGRQSIVLINRRGYSTVGICKDCRKTLQCEDCSVNLVRHKKQNRLVCHMCGRVYPVIEKCPECGGEIVYSGYGTQKVEEYIREKIPGAGILRFDYDTVGGSDLHDEYLYAFGQKQYDILIGTQMVAKGLDFEDVDLVCVLGIDSLLNHRGYSSNETAFNLMTQVIGRAGRRHSGATAMIRTYDPRNPVIALRTAGDYVGYYRNEAAYRKINNYPPYCTLVTVAFSHEKEERASRDAAAFLGIIRQTGPGYDIPLTVLGPAPFEVVQASGMYRWKLTVKCINNSRFRAFLRECIEKYLSDRDRKASIYVNINSAEE